MSEGSTRTNGLKALKVIIRLHVRIIVRAMKNKFPLESDKEKFERELSILEDK